MPRGSFRPLEKVMSVTVIRGGVAASLGQSNMAAIVEMVIRFLPSPNELKRCVSLIKLSNFRILAKLDLRIYGRPSSSSSSPSSARTASISSLRGWTYWGRAAKLSRTCNSQLREIQAIL